MFKGLDLAKSWALELMRKKEEEEEGNGRFKKKEVETEKKDTKLGKEEGKRK